MAMARKCDRCGSLYEEYDTKVKDAKGLSGVNGFAFTKRQLNGTHAFVEDYFKDLCPDCLESLLAWWREKRGAENG